MLVVAETNTVPAFSIDELPIFADRAVGMHLESMSYVDQSINHRLRPPFVLAMYESRKTDYLGRYNHLEPRLT